MSQLSLQQIFDLATQHHAAGRLAEAEKLYRQILARQPDNTDALRNLAVLAQQAGRNEASVELLRRVIALNPGLPEAHNTLGTALLGLGQLDQAIAAHRKAIALSPDYFQAHNNLGIALAQKQQFGAAIAAFSKAIALQPEFPEAQDNLRNAIKEQGLIDQSIAAARHAITLSPNNAQAYYSLGVILADSGQDESAIDAYRQAIALDPRNAGAHNNLGNALKKQGHLHQAIAAYRSAVDLQPDLREAHYNLGITLHEKGDLDDAVIAYRRAIELNLTTADAHYNLGIALWARGSVDDAIAAYRQALHLQPDHANIHHDLGLALLRRGDLQEGWREYEWRWKCPNLPLLFRGFSQPLWDGRNLAGLTILLHAEQGFGDAIQFIRYLPMVLQRGSRVIVEVPRPLIRLLRQLPGAEQWIALGEPLPAFDIHCPLLTLPLLFQTTLDKIPDQSPPLRADPELAEKWKAHLNQTSAACASPSLKIGLSWAGSPRHTNDRNRSVPLSVFAPLATVPGTRLYSLQKGPAAAQAANITEQMQLIDCTREIHDFADTAAMISHLDLIITVDTAVAHLAGAMGQPVWVLLPFRSDWRWLETRPNSPWYPSMRLFRQKGDGNWDEVISRVVDALVDLRSEPTPQPGFWRRLLFQPLVALYTRLRTSFLPT